MVWAVGGLALAGIVGLVGWLHTGTYTDERGYRRRRRDDKPVHRLVAECKLGRKLRLQEFVHHRYREKQDNRLQNLWVFPSKAAHEALNRRDLERPGGG